MNDYSIKSVAFGGFDKQDVIRYIEEAAMEAAGKQQVLQQENESLRKELDALTAECASLRTQLEEVTAQKEQLQKMFEEDSARYREELNTVRADAEAYAQFCEHIGSIEFEAHKRASDLENTTNAQLLQTVDLFRKQYQILMSSFESAAGYITGELRKIEVNLAQLPRAMDQTGSELNTLAAQLKEKN